MNLHKPLAFTEDLNRSLAAPACADTLFQVFLPVQNARFLHITKDSLTALFGGKALIRGCDGSHPAG